MLKFTERKSDCTGCSACYSICPQKCISMVPDKEGFLYPIASDNCIDCGLCEKICPINNPKQCYDEIQQHECYAAVTNSIDTWKASASGGAFSEICNAWGDSETLIVGAAWDGLRVHHIGVLGPENIAPLRKSKYVFSDMENVFTQIRDHLKLNKKVIFSGTPCQVAGLKSFLRKDFEKLLTIDLICHGGGSPSVFSTCMDIYKDEFGEDVVSYGFRAKGNQYIADAISYVQTQTTKRLYFNDRYNQLFYRQLVLRPSCGEFCKFRNSRRQGDITIADFKSLSKVFPKLGGENVNYSTIVFNSAKSRVVKPYILSSMRCIECEEKTVIKNNPLFAGQTLSNTAERDVFFADYEQNTKNAILSRTHHVNEMRLSLKRRLYLSLPKYVRVAINMFFNLKQTLRT